MRIQHVYDSSYIFQYVLNELYEFRLINIKHLSRMFDYDPSSIYKMIKKIDDNLVTINPKYYIKKIGPGIYKLAIME